MEEILHQPGFLGTSANFAADMTLVLSLAVAAALTIGFILARKKRFGAHRGFQTVAVVANAVLVLWMMILPFRDFVAPGLPERVGERFYGVTALHAALGVSALVFGVFVMLRGNGLMPAFLRFRDYRTFMRVSYTLYLLATLVGVLVYLTWFVGNPNPPTYS